MSPGKCTDIASAQNFGVLPLVSGYASVLLAPLKLIKTLFCKKETKFVFTL